MGFSPWSEDFSAALLKMRNHVGDAEFDVILGLAAYVRDALNGASPEQVAIRLDTLRDRLAPEYHNGRLVLAIPAIEEMIAAVEIEAQRRVEEMATAAIASYQGEALSVRGLPKEPPAQALHAIMKIGGMAKNKAAAVWAGIAEAMAPAGGGRE